MADNGWPLERHQSDGIFPRGESIAHADQRMSATRKSFPVLGGDPEPEVGNAAESIKLRIAKPKYTKYQYIRKGATAKRSVVLLCNTLS